ncbi:MAG TPA: exodeoxyribonuclease VII large subunit [Acidimicrobiales bacterium]|nr:exodeoxyribonuclease VII large subunit [Acidimicrobiales bacterium]
MARARELASRDSESLSIAALYSRVDQAVRRALPGQVWVSGEVRSMTVSARGICYLDLVDPEDRRGSDQPVLHAVCWSRRWAAVRATLDQLGVAMDTGLVVRVRGEVQMYPPRGELSFIVSDLDTEALVGRVAADRARLVKALVEAGLYDRNRKVPVPAVPSCVGLVASPGTEGFRDFLGQLEDSGIGFTVRLVPTRVQGRGAPALIAGAIRRLQAAGCDVIVVVRGGGSKADLAVFDSEPVARAIANSEVAVWTGIGHTGDLSVADEVANRTFVTPTDCGRELASGALSYWRSSLDRGRMAARLAAARLEGAERSLARRRRGIETGATRHLDRHADRLVHKARAVRGAVRGQVEGRRRELAHRSQVAARAAFGALRSEEQRSLTRAVRLTDLPTRVVKEEELRVGHRRSLLNAYDYRRQLERGYSVTRDASGSVVRSVAGVVAGARLDTQVADGSIESVVSATGARPAERPHRARGSG